VTPSLTRTALLPAMVPTTGQLESSQLSREQVVGAAVMQAADDVQLHDHVSTATALLSSPPPTASGLTAASQLQVGDVHVGRLAVAHLVRLL
jgi:hypothetical protein